MTRRLLLVSVLGLLVMPAGVRADHDPSHDTRHNPNCAWDSRRSADYDGDGEPDHFVAGVSQNTSFPQQVVEVLQRAGVPIERVPPFFGEYDSHDHVTVVVQGDHRMFGANPSHDPETGNPEQQHNGAIYAHVDYDEVEDGRAPRAEWGAGIYEANHLVMACGATDEPQEAALCLAGNEIYRQTDEPCPLD